MTQRLGRKLGAERCKFIVQVEAGGVIRMWPHFPGSHQIGCVGCKTGAERCNFIFQIGWGARTITQRLGRKIGAERCEFIFQVEAGGVIRMWPIKQCLHWRGSGV